MKIGKTLVAKVTISFRLFDIFESNCTFHKKTCIFPDKKTHYCCLGNYLSHFDDLIFSRI